MQPTQKYYEADAYRTEAAGRILAAERLRWTARSFTLKAAVSLPTGAP